jgi:DNA-binding NtrC family response regulator
MAHLAILFADKTGMELPGRLLTLTPTSSGSVPLEENKARYDDESMFLIGSSPAISQLLGQIRRVAPYFRTALVTGERNCGELAAAHMLHRLCPMGSRPFLELTADEAESRLRGRTDYDALATEGMLYLPHPERLPQFAQTALIRLLRERGSNAPRLVAFAERGLRSLVSMGAFSSELAESLGALRIAMPPIRDRAEDLSEVFKEILRSQANLLSMVPPELSPALLDAVIQHPWPGNFDQMRSMAVALLEHGAGRGHGTGAPLDIVDMNAVLGATPEPLPRERREIRMVSLDRVIQEHVRAVLFASNGNKLRAAEILGISRSTLYRMLESQPLEESHSTLTSSSSRAEDHPQLLKMAG